MKRLFAGLSDPGLIRTVNQDNYHTDQEGRFFIVADGMGGHAGGQEASRIATEVIRDYLDANWNGPGESYDLLEKAIYQANEGILEDQYTHPERGDMGTTVVVIIFRNNETWRAHVGDSRLYRLRDSKLEQLTQDHTWIAQAVNAGEISSQESKTHPWRHVLSQCLGRKDLYEGIDIQTLEAESGDRFLLCSDGLTEEVPEDLIFKYLEQSENLEETANKLIEEAKKAGGSDNVTVVLVAQP